MGEEIEKKYLLMKKDPKTDEQRIYASQEIFDRYPSMQILIKGVRTEGKEIRQGYMDKDSGFDLAEKLGLKVDFMPKEARLRDKAGKLFFTMKGEGGLERNELEATVDQETFDRYWGRTEGRRVEKSRLKREFKGYELEIDVYPDKVGLVVAEIEFPSFEEAERMEPLGLEVSEDPAYKNKNLAC